MRCRYGSLVVMVLLALARGAPALGQDQTTVGDLAELLALEDRREFDAATLRRAAQSPDSVLRVRAAMALGRIGDLGAVPILLPLLADRDTGVRAEAAFALGELGDTAAVPVLVRLVDAFDPVEDGDFEAEVVTALAKIGGEDADRTLERLLQRHPPDGPASDRASAVVLLEAWRRGRASPLAPRLVEYVRIGTGAFRQNATYSAARLRLPAAASALLEAATDAEPLTRSYAARALTAPLADSAGLTRDIFVGRVRALLGDPSSQVRINALRALATFRDSALAGVASGRMVDRDPNVPVQAAATLGSLGGSRAVTVLRERFGPAGTFALKRAILLGLAQAAPETALAVARPWRADQDWRNRAAYAEMLGAVATPAARAQLTELLGDADPRVVATALGALGQASAQRDPATRVAARAKLAEPDVIVRTAAIDILGRDADPALLPDLVAAYRRAELDEQNDARLAAVQAFWQVAQGGGENRAAVERSFLAATPRSADYLVRRAVAERFGEETHARYWGDVLPVATGKSPEDYRQIARRYVLRSGSGSLRVTIVTDRGNIVLDLFGYDAPLTVDNFLRLVDRRFFDNHRWHRVVPNFVIQDGDPRGDGSGGPGTVIRDEINRRRYDRGAVGMALSGPDTGGSQYFITHSPQPHLDGAYTAFGQVGDGYGVLDQMVQGDRIRRIFR
ncbi:MAG: HEAT repeat domain-containing protein [Gemmatimonadetes bacterium]|nr:HEAT repeat domain-containing protein [Gemmatimonadota bacterium]